MKYLVIVSRFNEFITKTLLEGATETFRESDVSSSDVDVIWVPGSFELPVAAMTAARSEKYDAIVCIGAIIRGETSHFDYVAGETARGIMDAGLQTGVPVIFGVLTTETQEQALARCGIKGGNKGREAAHSAITMTKVLNQLRAKGKSKK